MVVPIPIFPVRFFWKKKSIVFFLSSIRKIMCLGNPLMCFYSVSFYLPTIPGVNARVSAVSDWIDHTVRKLSKHPPAEFFLSAEVEIPSLPTTRLEEVEEEEEREQGEAEEAPSPLILATLPTPPSRHAFFFRTTPIFETIAGGCMLFATSMLLMRFYRERRRRRQAYRDTTTLLELHHHKDLTSSLLTRRTAAFSDGGSSYGSMESMASSTSSTSNDDDQDAISLQ
jgi:hypothetical protein